MSMIRSYLNCIYYLIAMKNNNIINLKNLPYEFDISNTTFYKSITIQKAHCLKSTLMFSTQIVNCVFISYIYYEI